MQRAAGCRERGEQVGTEHLRHRRGADTKRGAAEEMTAGEVELVVVEGAHGFGSDL
jgi:hypothetical protein